MTDLVTMQELFDGQKSFDIHQARLNVAFHELWKKHSSDKSLDEWPASYYNDLSDMAHTFGVVYSTPTHLGKLTEVGSSTTIH